MKIRSGFVSNSSSSSFILVFDKAIESMEELANQMDRCYPTCGYGAEMNSEDVVARVWSDMQEKGIASEEQVIYEYCYDFDGPFPPRYNEIQAELDKLCYDSPDRIAKLRALWDERTAIYESIAREAAMKFVESRKGKVFYVLEYSDNHSDVETGLEHGNVFRHVQHMRISKH